MFDAIIVGGGPAGLSAALILGRCRRSVLLCDAGKQRNRCSLHMHGYLTRDGISPAEFLECARAQLEPYGVQFCGNTVREARKEGDEFEITLDEGSKHRGRRLLLATGVSDHVPEIEGIHQFYGKSVHHCPYCDGWEHRDQRIAIYSKGGKGFGLALSLKTWSRDVVLCTDGPARITASNRDRLARHGIAIRRERIERLEGRGEQLERVVYQNGAAQEFDALFFSTPQNQACNLASNFGCIFNKKGTVETNRLEGTNVPGLYVAGDASRDVQLVIVAAAEGAKAAFAMNTSLQKEELA